MAKAVKKALKAKPAMADDAPKSSEGQAAKASEASPAVTTAPAGSTSDAAGGPAAADASPVMAPAGTFSSDAPPEPKTANGGGDPAAPVQRPKARVDAADFAARYPLTDAALAAWRDANPEGHPSAVRIASKREGFRRAGMSHTKAPVEHPIEIFTVPEQLEALFAESTLTVEIV
jgi:hypothetical protein